MTAKTTISIVLFTAITAFLFPAGAAPGEQNRPQADNSKKEVPADIRRAIEDSRFLFMPKDFFWNGRRFPVGAENFIRVNNNFVTLQLRSDLIVVGEGLARIIETRPVQSIEAEEDQEGTITLSMDISSGGLCVFTIPPGSDECSVSIKTPSIANTFYFTGKIIPENNKRPDKRN